MKGTIESRFTIRKKLFFYKEETAIDLFKKY
jgi:hypothetical protein